MDGIVIRPDRPTTMSELGRALYWQPQTVLGMLWLYMDDSGEHDRETGTLRRLTLAGGVTTYEGWEMFSIEWCAHLERFKDHGISWFKMSDFEARVPPYDKLGKAERQDLLNGLLDIGLKYVPLFFGTTDEPEAMRLDVRHAGHVIKTKSILSEAARAGNGHVRLVLSHQKDIRPSKLIAFVEDWETESFRFEGFGDPRTFCPLQLADIVAYEFSRAMRAVKPEKERYPLTRLKTASSGCHLMSVKFLKTMDL
jgi:hypothetical protein